MSNAHDTITQFIAEALESGTVPWRRPWRHDPTTAQRSIHGHVYRGCN